MARCRGCDDLSYRCNSCGKVMCISSTMRERIRIVGSRFSPFAGHEKDKFNKDIVFVFNLLSDCCTRPDWRKMEGMSEQDCKDVMADINDQENRFRDDYNE